MIPQEFEQQNFTFVKPDSMTDEECSPLIVYKGPDPDGSGTPVIISKWIDPETGTAVFLKVVGYVPPPVYVGTEDPFENNRVTSEQKVGYIIASQQINPSKTSIEWMKKIIAGDRSFTQIYIASFSDLKSGELYQEKANFISHFIGPWNILFKNDQMSF